MFIFKKSIDLEEINCTRGKHLSGVRMVLVRVARSFSQGENR